jgi:uncharacterized membrane protein
MKALELLEVGLGHFVMIVKFFLETLSVICVVIGLIKTLQLSLVMSRRRWGSVFPFSQIRLRFGAWLSLALEFQLGADIVSTTVAPSLEALGNLALLAIIRTFLNYFLGKELEAGSTLEKKPTELIDPAALESESV